MSFRDWTAIILILVGAYDLVMAFKQRQYLKKVTNLTPAARVKRNATWTYLIVGIAFIIIGFLLHFVS